MPGTCGPIRNIARLTALFSAGALLILLSAWGARAADPLVVTNTNDSGSGSLRQALLDANAAPGLDTINFSIGTGPQSITPLSSLPEITSPVILDGRTQPGYDGSPLIELNGSSTTNTTALVISAGASSIYGLTINRFYRAITLGGAGGNTIQGCRIGTNAAGTAAQANTDIGILVVSAGNTVGGTTPVARNLISGNPFGIFLYESVASNNSIQGNYIGTNAAGTGAIPNTQAGVHSGSASHNTIGGTTPGAGNVISGNSGQGINFGGIVGTGNQILGNLIGTNAAGTGALPNANGIISTQGGTQIGGTTAASRNVISGNAGRGIWLINPAATATVIQGNYIGTDITGAAALPNGEDGILLADVPGCTIGGGAGAANVISGNSNRGVLIVGSQSTGNTVSGNRVGTNKDGTAALGNLLEGIYVGSSSNSITFNLASGNGRNGINIGETSASNNVIQGNRVGTDASGTSSVPNGWAGGGGALQVSGTNHLVGGTAPDQGNLVSGNAISGIYLAFTGTTGNRVEGNLVGTDVTGTLALGNANVGIVLDNVSGNTIGGAALGARNVVAKNAHGGVYLAGPEGGSNQVQGNYIGTDVSGLNALGNGDYGMVITSPGNTVGGTSAGSGNVIAANLGPGISMAFPSATQNLVQGNLIGVAANGTSALGNAWAGIQIGSGALNNLVGGTAAGAGNTIAFAATSGVLAHDGTGNRVLGNSFHSNAGLAIDLGADWITANDPGDTDTGANGLQNYPVLSSVSSGGGSTTVSGELNSASGSNFRLEFFSNAVPDPSGSGEAETYLGYANVSTPGGGTVSFNATLPTATASGRWVTATATDDAGNTSELSVALRYSGPPDTTPPGCSVGAVVASPTRVYVPITLTDAGSGVAGVKLTSNSTNCQLEWDGPGGLVAAPINTVIPISPASPSITVRAVKLNVAQKARVELRAMDAAGNFVVCDPVIANLEVKNGRALLIRNFAGIPQAERYVTLQNGAPGLTQATLSVNGHVVSHGRLTSGQVVSLDVARWLRPGNRNVVRIHARGPKGATAVLTIGDVIPGTGHVHSPGSAAVSREFSRY